MTQIVAGREPVTLINVFEVAPAHQNYAQWQTREAFERMPEFPGAREHMERAAQLAVRFTPSLYEVVATHERG